MTGPDRVVAIDIGGTKVALAIVAADGTLQREVVVATLACADADEVFAEVARGLRELLTEWPAGEELYVGMGSAGPIDAPRGEVSPVNIAAWRGFPVVARVAQVCREVTGTEPVRVLLAGDGHCITLGEHWLGAGRDVDSMVGMVVSTGVGGGAVIRGELVTGSSGNAVHVGHTSIDFDGEVCVCGCRGCVEMYASGPAMVSAARRKGWQGTDARELAESARAGDPVALGAVDDGMRALAAGIATAASYLDVRTVVLGGGVSKAGEVVFEPLRRHLGSYATLPYVRGLEVRPAELENAGLLGAAAIALGRVVLR